eukprot:TRINITY_DN1143_c0_g2_i8.p2 TRINITY_DN1143_c0_g2~~TRINITY_DN1143_c0_g2_i8.p2  ORF type:complete len:322 (+),score=58.54 TRINITY_DN1143_c0_g2_i8:75-968(+)
MSGDGDKKKPAKKDGIHGLSDTGGGGGADDDRDVYYAGGGKDSGTAIVDGSSGGGMKDLWKNLEAAGAVKKGDAQASAGFTGAGYRLGAAHTGATAAAPGTARPPERSVRIVFWRNGFSVDEGPLQDPSTDKGKKFVEDISRGVVPTQLQMQLREEYVGKTLPEVEIEVIDKTAEMYKKLEPSFKAFAGEGRTMGSAAPAAAAGPAAPAAPAGPLPHVDPDKESTSICAQMPDGSRLTLTLNLDHTVGHLRSLVGHSQAGLPSFDLLTTFPRKVLSDDAATIKDAGLKKAVVVVKPK